MQAPVLASTLTSSPCTLDFGLADVFRFQLRVPSEERVHYLKHDVAHYGGHCSLIGLKLGGTALVFDLCDRCIELRVALDHQLANFGGNLNLLDHFDTSRIRRICTHYAGSCGAWHNVGNSSGARTHGLKMGSTGSTGLSPGEIGGSAGNGKGRGIGRGSSGGNGRNSGGRRGPGL
jgi:hypothetical protein